MIKILCVCGNGLGSSFACQMATEGVLKELGVEAKMDHIDISSAAGQKADLILSGKNFERMATAIPLALDGGLRQPKLDYDVIILLWAHGNQETDTNLYYSIILFLSVNTKRDDCYQSVCEYIKN